MSFITKLRFFINNMNNIMQGLKGTYYSQGLPALCMDIPGNTGFVTQSPKDTLKDLLQNPILYAVPRHRRTLEKRLSRKNMLPQMQTARPKKNIVTCLTCGHPHEIQTICGNCYDKVRKETQEMRDTMDKDVYKYDYPRQEVAFLYEGENVEDIPKYKGRYLVEIPKRRPSWFSKDLLKKDKEET